jgi:hypothetical protein
MNAADRGARPSARAPGPETLPTLERYALHLRATTAWMLRSIEAGGGGSCAYFSPVTGWSRPYPETTGYLIPTLLELERALPGADAGEAALRAGRWLLEVQRPDGAWNGGVHPPRQARASVFNTGQILKGMMALYRATGDARWLRAADRGARWLAAGAADDGLWGGGDYRARETPSYYTHVLWPMLEVWSETGDGAVRDAARRGLETILARRTPAGEFRGWAFKEGQPAVTHTIAYTLRGILECGRLLGEWERCLGAAIPALEVLVRRGELRGGHLPGAFHEGWKADRRYVCLTGNAQVAICLLQWEAHAPDLRLVSAAARMVDVVCAAQRLRSPVPGVRGAVGGSAPLWGPYMRMRYPNWAAKYLCDALLRLSDRVRRELPA